MSRLFEAHTAAELAGKQRLHQLLQWMKEDRDRNDLRFTTALKRWRDDVRPRLHGCAPHVMKIPECFVFPLGLQSQHVIMEDDGSVWVPWKGRPDSKIVHRSLLIPAATQ